MPIRYAKRIARRLRHGIPRRARAWKMKTLRWGFLLRGVLFPHRPVQVDLEPDITLRMAPKGATASDLWTGLRFEANELRFLLGILEPGMTFLDIGSDAGIFAIAAAKKLGEGKAYAFEPCSATFKLLERNVRLNRLGNVEAVRTAVGDHVGQAVLRINAPGKDRLNTLGMPSHPDCQIVAQQTVPVTTLDAFLEAKGISKVDVMKVDVEGAELRVFRGAKNLLERADAPLILYAGYSWCTRGFCYHPVEIMWLLADHGYVFFALDGESGRASPRRPHKGYDDMVIAAKPGHPCFGRLQGRAQ